MRLMKKNHAPIHESVSFTKGKKLIDSSTLTLQRTMPIRAQFLISFGNETKEELEFSFQLAVLSITGLN